jgi:hypothetical protein
MSAKCTAMRRDGHPCRAWAMAGTDPPRCAAHGAAKGRVGAPLGNENALKHGFYSKPSRPLETIDDALQHLAECLTQLADYVRDSMYELSVDDMARLSAVRGQNLSRYVRMLRDKAAMSGDLDDELEQQVAEALRLVSKQLGEEFS